MYVVPTETDLTAILSRAEIDTYRRSEDVAEGQDPVAALLAQAAAMVRSYVRANGRVTLSPTPGSIPASLMGALCAYVAFDILKRQPVPVGEDRRTARREAIELLDKVAAGKITPESHNEESGETPTAPLPSFAVPPPVRVL